MSADGPEGGAAAQQRSRQQSLVGGSGPTSASAAPVTELDRVVAYANRFSIKLFKHVAALDARCTVCIGPFTVFRAMCAAYAGAQGNTEHQMAKAFKASNTRTLHGQWEAPGRAVCVQDEPDSVREHVNSTVEKDTSGAIPQLLVSGVTDPDSRVVFYDSLYVKAAWEGAFPATAAATEKHPYTVSSGRSPALSMGGGNDRGPELVRISGVYRHCRDPENKLLAVE
ncbi:hypothetical protein V5799_017778, partial [Amblyomma americanum]